MYEDQQGKEIETHVSTEDARSGASTHVTRYVLPISLALAILVLVLVMVGGFWKTDRTGADNVQTTAPAQANAS